MSKARQFSAEVRERAVRLVREREGEYPSQWAALQSIASKIGCSAETLRGWVRQAERNAGRRPGLAALGIVRPFAVGATTARGTVLVGR